MHMTTIASGWTGSRQKGQKLTSLRGFTITCRQNIVAGLKDILVLTPQSLHGARICNDEREQRNDEEQQKRYYGVDLKRSLLGTEIGSSYDVGGAGNVKV